MYSITAMLFNDARVSYEAVRLRPFLISILRQRELRRHRWGRRPYWFARTCSSSRVPVKPTIGLPEVDSCPSSDQRLKLTSERPWRTQISIEVKRSLSKRNSAEAFLSTETSSISSGKPLSRNKSLREGYARRRSCRCALTTSTRSVCPTELARLPGRLFHHESFGTHGTVRKIKN